MRFSEDSNEYAALAEEERRLHALWSRHEAERLVERACELTDEAARRLVYDLEMRLKWLREERRYKRPKRLGLDEIRERVAWFREQPGLGLNRQGSSGVSGQEGLK